ncbi:MAG TPA: biopolymer transporter Tol [Planctomycetaceae bacterium]|nr:biopolymer transporter Tol [Planctomycetaceae bacterium]
MNRLVLVCLALLGLTASFHKLSAEEKPLPITEYESKYLENVRQVTFGLPRSGEGYFSQDGEWIVYQAYPVGYPFYQIYVQKLDEREPRRISTGRGRTTCAYFTPDRDAILFASSHSDPDIEITEQKARELAAAGGRRRYEWDFDPHMEIYVANFDGTGLKRLTDSPGYDAEGSYSSDGKQIVFTSTRDGDPDIYIMNADGSNVRQIVDQSGYDGGPFFSPDEKWIIFRSDREEKDMLQIRAVSVDGKHDVRLTDNLQQVNWCPYFHPSGKYIIWSGADYSQGPRSANFDLWVMEIEYTDTEFKGGKVTRITDHEAADVLPVFSPDGTKLMWTSTKRGGDDAAQLWIADWKLSN